MPNRVFLTAIFSVALLSLSLLPACFAKSSPVTRVTSAHRWITQEGEWLNTQRALKPEDLKGRLILLDFWTYCCINCMHVIPDLQRLEKEFGPDLTVIGVHSAKFANEKESENIRSAIVRYGIEHPVVNDASFKVWNSFSVSGWPTLVLIDPDGEVARTFSGEGNLEALRSEITKLIGRYRGVINRTALPIALEKNRSQPSTLSFPGKLVYVSDFNGAPILFVSDSNHHRILGIRLSGKVELTVGGETRGQNNGDFSTARFNRPQGLLYRDRTLFVADTENHLLRAIHFSTGKVETLAGTGEPGNERAPHEAAALKTPLSSPWDLSFYPGPDEIAIAMAGTHQIWSYHLKKKTLNVLAGSGAESIVDGRYPSNSLAQPSGLSTLNGKLYFVDSETSSLRVLDSSGVHTLIGTGLFQFGFHDGKQGDARMQHPIGVFADASGIYVADTYNHSIRRFDLGTKRLTTFAGDGHRGNRDGKALMAQFNEPNAITRGKEGFFIADTNNSTIRKLDPTTLEVSTLDLKPAGTKSLASQPTKKAHTLSSSLPNLQKASPQTLPVGVEIPVIIDLEKDWKMNDLAPSWMGLFRMKGGTGQSVREYTKEELGEKSLKLPALAAGQYRLQGSFYFCKYGAGALCTIQSRDQAIEARGTAGAKIPTVEIKLRP